MSRQLRVNTDELRIAADQLDMHAADLRHDHAAAHANMASAVPGFGATSSAAALTERIAQWEKETAQHHAEIGRHAEGHRVAGTSYTTTDSDSSAEIVTAGCIPPLIALPQGTTALGPVGSEPTIPMVDPVIVLPK